MVTGQEHVLFTATLDFWCHRDLCEAHQRVSLEIAVWLYFPASTRQLSSIRGSQAQCSCWGVPQQGSCGCGEPPLVAVYQGVWSCPSLWSLLSIWWNGAPSRHVQLLLTSPSSLSGSPPSAPSVWSYYSLGLYSVGLATAAGGSVHHLGLLLHCPSLNSRGKWRHQASLHEVRHAGDLQVWVVTPLSAVQS